MHCKIFVPIIFIQRLYYCTSYGGRRGSSVVSAQDLRSGDGGF